MPELSYGRRQEGLRECARAVSHAQQLRSDHIEASARQTRMHAVSRRTGAGGELGAGGAWRRSGLGFADAQGRQDAVPMHQVPYRRGLAARRGRQTDRGELGRGGTDLRADGMRGMPSGGGLRGHCEDRPEPETRGGKARPVVDPAMDRRPEKLPAVLAHAGLRVLARPGDCAGCVHPGQFVEEFEAVARGASRGCDAGGRRQESGVRRGRQGAVRIGRLQRMPRDRPAPTCNSGRRQCGLRAGPGVHGQGLRAQPRQDRGEDFGGVDICVVEEST